MSYIDMGCLMSSDLVALCPLTSCRVLSANYPQGDSLYRSCNLDGRIGSGPVFVL
jgi:hypothetical protein